MSRTFGTAQATRRDRRAMAEAKLLGLRAGKCDLHEAGRALHQARHGAGSDNFLQGESLAQLSKKIGKELILEGILEHPGMSPEQLGMSSRVRDLVKVIRVDPTGPFSDAHKGQIQRTGVFEQSGMLCWPDIPEHLGAETFYSWSLTMNDFYTKETPDVDIVGRPSLDIHVEYDDDGQLRVRSAFRYGTATNETEQSLMLTMRRWASTARPFFTPEGAPQALLDNFNDFMTRAEAVANKF